MLVFQRDENSALRLKHKNRGQKQVIEREIRGSLEEETQVDHKVFLIGEHVCYQNSIYYMGELFYIGNLKCQYEDLIFYFILKKDLKIL